ncbi:MAG: rhodanese-like domain-containing protein [Gemmatimonadaceae bacterium]
MNARPLLATVALVLGALALVAGSPEPRRGGNGSVDVARLARSVEAQADHVDALELAEWIKDRKSGLRVIDVRAEEAFNEYHIPSAEWIPLSTLAKTTFEPNETIVLYSDGGAHAAQGWVFLQLAGYHNAFFLRGGLLDWLEDVMNPKLVAGASDSATKEYEAASALSRYFGGQPLRETASASGIPMPTVETGGGATTVQSLIRKRKKRGC